jgi:hypothetical protein
MKHPNPERLVVTEGIPIYDDHRLSDSHKHIERTHNCALCWSIAPRFVVAGEDAKVAATNKFFVIEAKDGIVRVEEIRMEYDLNAIIMIVEELYFADLVENRVVVIVNHIMRGDWRKGVSFESQDTTLQKDVVFFG